ncbi:MAG: RecX family transcriptional regulator [Candidatus Absconditabacteria bacterium]
MKKDCLEYALNYIYNYPKTEAELIIQLKKKGYLESEINKTISFLKHKNYVNDNNFAEIYINGEVGKKGKPLALVYSKLLHKGVSKEVIEKAIAANNNDIKKGTIHKIKKEIEKLKAKGESGFDIIQKLMRRGYKLDEIKKCLE